MLQYCYKLTCIYGNDIGTSIVSTGVREGVITDCHNNYVLTPLVDGQQGIALREVGNV